MRTRLISSIAMTALGFACWTLPGRAQTERPTIAVLDFDSSSVQQEGATDIGRDISDSLVDELVNDGSFRLIERKRIAAVFKEQDFGASDRVGPSAGLAAKIGGVLGAKYLIVGTVTHFGVENDNKSVSGSLLKRVGAGSAGTTSSKAAVSMSARIINATTGEIVVAAKGEGTSKRTRISLKGDAGNVSSSSSDFLAAILGEATEAAVKDTALGLIEKRARVQ